MKNPLPSARTASPTASLHPPEVVFGFPDFRNQGVWLRLLLATNGVMLLVALIGNRQLAQWPFEVIELAALVEPAVLLTLLLLFALNPQLQSLARQRRGGRPGSAAAVATVVTLSVMVMLATQLALGMVFQAPQTSLLAAGWRAPLAAGTTAALLLYWFALRARAQSPALAEARLMALTARIRPHFLFNSLNAVLGILRDDPRRAETALEELAELFRALMQNNTGLTGLSEEIALARKYLEIEHLRLGERLQVVWQIDAAVPDTQVPPLLLQPLLENAVHHGIEPVAGPGEIRIGINATRDGVRIDIDNPCPPPDTQSSSASGESPPPRHGNQMALDNLRERLMLFYDLEARLDTRQTDGRYRVQLHLPWRKRP